MSSAVPDGWITQTVGESIEHFQNGYGFSSSGYEKSGIPIISIVNISLDGNFKFDVTKEKKWSSSDLDKLHRYQVKNNDLIIAMTDVTPTMAMIGRGAVVNRKTISLLNQRVGLLKPKDSVLSKYLAYVFNGDRWRKSAQLSASLGAQANLGTADILKMNVLLPPLPEQKKIASILTSVDEVIENTQKQIDKLQDLKKATMNELLTKGIGHTEFKDSELGRIPKSWEVKKLNELCSPTSPITYGVLKPGNYIEGGIPLLQVKDLKGGSVDKSDIHRISTSLDQEYSRSRVRFHDILISLIGTVGRVSLMPKVTEAYNIHRNIGRIRLENPEWVFLHLQSQKGVQQIQLASSGSSQSALNLSALKEFLISIPPLMEQSDIVSIISSISESLTSNYRKLHQTQSLKKSLMQDLLTGKVRVRVN